MKRAYSVVKRFFFEVLSFLGIPSLFPYFSSNNLTVLNYHRIDDPNQEGFNTLKVNVSATPADFARQMKYVKKHFNVVSVEMLVDWLQGKISLPPRPAVITFDDGYYDNFSNAYPVLKALKLPAVIFLATAYIGKDSPFYWDYIAYCFANTNKTQVDLPVIGFSSWVDSASREATMLRWIEALKKIPDIEKQEAVSALSQILAITIQDIAFVGLHLTWDKIREMAENNIEFGAHTVNHPILTRISLEKVENELITSKRIIEAELGKPVLSFAYPNGGFSDFSDDIVKIVDKVGFKVAFTLISGPTTLSSVKNNPFTVRRIYIGNHDDYSRFVFKVSGIAKLFSKNK